MQRVTVFVLAALVPTPIVLAQSSTRASVSSTAVQGNADSMQAVASSDARFTAFASLATNFVADLNGLRDVFRHDRVTGQTVLVSVSLSGVPGSGDSFNPAITPNGRYVGFTSTASDLNAADTNGTYDVFVRDMFAGTTELISKNSSGVSGNLNSDLAELSHDGRYVVFNSWASDLVTGDTNSINDVFMRDRTLGTTIRVNVDSSGNQANGLGALFKGDLRISGDGRYVSFTSDATNLVSPDTNGLTVDVFIRDLQLGLTTIGSQNSFGAQGNSWSGHHALSFDGRFLAFTSHASNLVPNDLNLTADIFVHDRGTGYTSRTSISSTGVESNGFSDSPTISNDGRYVAFDSFSNNLAPNAPLVRAIYMRDRATGLTTLESPNTSNLGANGASEKACIDVLGRRVVFESVATDIVAGDTNSARDTFIRFRGPLPVYTSYCFGDGLGSACPCANESLYGNQEGCKGSQGYGGKLTAMGSADVITDTFVLRGSQLGTSACLYFQGTTTMNNGLGIAFGDGLLCAGGEIVRLAVKFNIAGVSQYPHTGDLPISQMSVIPGGSSRTYQIWFRDAVPYCTSATYNMTNAIEVIWTPCAGC